jgi:hypothetical protein
MSEFQQQAISIPRQAIRADSAILGSPSPLWLQIRDSGITRLSQGFALAISYVIGDLTEQAKQARDLSQLRLIEQSKDTLRHARDNLVASFQRRFSEYSSPKGEAESSGRGKDLRLMSEHDFHDSSAHDVIAQAINTLCDPEIRMLTSRFLELAKSAPHPGPVNPVEAELIGQAVLTALRERDVTLPQRRLLAPRLAEHMAISVRALYQDIIALFAGKGPLAAKPAPTSQIAAATSPQATAQTAGMPVRSRPLSAALTTLTQLQQGKIQTGKAIPPDTTETLQVLTTAQFMAELGYSGRIALDMVGALFETILNDRGIPAAQRYQLGRLQLPALKIALLDPGFLKRPDHPVRALLDRLVQRAHLAASLSDQAGLLQALTTFADKTCAEFGETPEFLVQTWESIEANLPAPSKQATPEKPAAIEPVRARADKESAQNALRAQLQGRTLPQSVGNFLIDHWEAVNAGCASVTQPTGESATEPGATLDQLMHTLEPKNWRNDRAALLRMLPGVLKQMKTGMVAAGLEAGLQDKFLTGLAKCHALVMQHARDQTASTPDKPTGGGGESPAKASPTSSTVASPPPVPTHGLNKQAVAESITKAKADRYDNLVRTLQRGALVEFKAQDGSMSWLKLAWISPNGGIFVFTNTQGERALTINASALAERLRQEQAQVTLGSAVTGGAAGRHLTEVLRHVA